MAKRSSTRASVEDDDRQVEGDVPVLRPCSFESVVTTFDSDSPRSLTDEKMVSWTFFLKAYKVVVEDIDRGMRTAAGVTLAEYEILFGLREAGGRLRFIEMSRSTLLSQSRISRLVDGLQTKGYVKREITDSDRRATFAILTPKGMTAFQSAHEAVLAGMHDHFFDLIPAGELAAFTKVLGSLLRDPEFYERNKEVLRKAREQNLGEDAPG